jgi:hypothetical protein
LCCSLFAGREQKYEADKESGQSKDSIPKAFQGRQTEAATHTQADIRDSHHLLSSAGMFLRTIARLIHGALTALYELCHDCRNYELGRLGSKNCPVPATRLHSPLDARTTSFARHWRIERLIAHADN